jgi:hypothetical protein
VGKWKVVTGREGRKMAFKTKVLLLADKQVILMNSGYL